MFHTPDYYHNISMRLSEVLDDIGVNENMVMKRRRTYLLKETVDNIINRATKEQRTDYMLGSRSEGTTTAGLESDADNLLCADDVFVIQDWSEWSPGKVKFLMMIQNETTPPGYCLLQELRQDARLPDTHETGNNFVMDTHGRILCKNTIIDDALLEGCRRQGPSVAIAEHLGTFASDIVVAFPCKSWPQSSRACLDRQETNSWPTAEMKRYEKTTLCYVVGVGSKVSENADFEWRISTSLAERCLMFNLNITQIRIYILMKMILKTYINVESLKSESYISSFMCKTVLFYCIASKPSKIWKECNILNCLNVCIQTLNRCILGGNCPHFFDRENNSMAGKISTVVKQQLLKRMSNLIPCDETSLFGIQIDDLGERLQIKLSMMNEVQHDILQPEEYTMYLTAGLLQDTIWNISNSHNELFHSIKDISLEMKLIILFNIVLHLTRYYRDGDMLEKTACRLQASVYCTSIGSLKASQNIQINRTVSRQAFDWLEAGLDTDVASSRLKLASIMYCIGDMKRAA
ncbi:uncharacterized protein LOC123556808 [Mercenaria mercenaria]|uniref:uncharacterized protein LOC123556808 n=1 Tax=Mercenaria mercenaria TaxID=6596 RepID=UPI00234F9762|nr:uncharacterized protein LOC123556808 [Mercenaria mercenaria]